MLDPYSREELIDYIKELNREGLTIIMITHDINEALLANRILVMNKGKISAFDRTENIMRNKEVFTLSNLELPVALDLANSLPNSDQGKLIKEALWEYALIK
jgi:energy-coupling factor transport system ATP-binding protein